MPPRHTPASPAGEAGRDGGTTGVDRPFGEWGPVGAPRSMADHERLAASFVLMEAALHGTRPAGMLTLVAERARLMAHAPLAFVALPDEAGHTLRIEFTAGADGDRVRGSAVRLGRSMLGRVFSSRRALSARVAADPTPGGLPGGLPAGPILILPLETGEATRGVLAVLGRPGAQPFSQAVAHRLLLFADMSARLIELAEARHAADAAGSAVGGPRAVLGFPPGPSMPMPRTGRP